MAHREAADSLRVTRLGPVRVVAEQAAVHSASSLPTLFRSEPLEGSLSEAAMVASLRIRVPEQARVVREEAVSRAVVPEATVEMALGVRARSAMDLAAERVGQRMGG
jgi:hypothetical protein